MSAKSVLISGAGIAGPALAYWLKRAGFAPTLVEHAPALRRGGFVIDFWGLGYELAGRMGLADDIERVGFHMRELRIVDDRGAKTAGFGTAVFRELTGGRFVTLGRSDLSRLLYEKISGSVETTFGDEIVGLEERPQGVRASFRYAADRHFDLVIGADGLHSRVRTLVFGPQDRFERRLGYMVAAFEARAYRPRDEDVYVIYCQPGRMLGRFALRDDRTLFLFVFVDAAQASAMALGMPAQKSVLRDQFGGGKWEFAHILDELDRTENLYFDQVSQITMPSWSRGRVALIGDAAFCVSLMAGQGSALAMTAAYVLAGELAAASGDYARAFAAYEQRLRAYIGSKQKAAERFSRAFAPQTRWGLFLRNQVIRACALPGVAKLALGRDMSDAFALPDYVSAAG